MKRVLVVIAFSLILLMPSYAANAQTSDRIKLLDNFGEYQRGDQLFIFGSLSSVLSDSFLILQVINPNGDLCQIQQVTPLSNGLFVTESIPLSGRICGLPGEYEVKVFYGDHSTTAGFTVSSIIHQQKTGAEYFDNASQLISDKIADVEFKTGASTTAFSDRLTALTSESSDGTIAEFEQLYIDLIGPTFSESDLFDIDVMYRTAVESALDTTSELIESGKLSFDVGQTIDNEIFAGIFYSQIGDNKKSIDKLNEVFVLITNVDPVKAPAKKALTYVELEEALLNLMKKTNSVMNRDLKESIALIFSRGTGPLYADELDRMLDLLTQARYLDVISRKDSTLYNIVNTQWETTKSSLTTQTTLDDFLEKQEKVAEIHKAALLLRELDNVDRFISTEDDAENSELAALLLPEWESLELKLELAATIDDILESETEIKDMKNVIDISSRISKAVDIAKESNVDSDVVSGWEALLVQVESTESIPEILTIVTEFDASITELREKRNPITILKFEYETLKTKAELQADHKNLFLINNALKILETAENMEKGTSTNTSRIDRIEVLLSWASAKAPEIKQELNSFSQDANKLRASDILQRAKSVENLVDLSLRTKKFLPGYTNFTDSMNERLNEARDLIIAKDLDAADTMVRALFDEWQQISKAYEDDPYGSDVGYSVDELKRIEYREQLESLSNTVSNFYNADFDPYSDQFVSMTDDAYELIDYGNFIDAETKIKEIGSFLSDKLALSNQKIIYDISYDQPKDIWVLQGAVDKPDHPRKHELREDLYVTVYNMDGTKHSSLEFTDTKDGEFFTQWQAPTDPGVYIVMLQYKDAKASQIVNIGEKIERVYSTAEIDTLDLAREFEELKSFIEQFGGANYQQHQDKFEVVFDQIKRGLADRNPAAVSKGLSDLDLFIERYLPMRSKYGVVEANYDNDKLHVAGSVVIGYLDFREDLFVDIFNQKGERIDTIAFKHSPSGQAGKFDESLSKSYPSGTYVAQLQYHDLFVSDFFHIN